MPSIGRPETDRARRTSGDLRTSAASEVRARRRILAAALVAGASYLPVVAYQAGLLRHLPEPPLPGLDADKVDASPEAYWPGSTPDAALGLLQAAATMALAGMGPQDRWRTSPWIPLLLAAKAAGDAAGAALLTAEQVTRHRRICSYCTVAAAATAATLPLALPEARAAWGELRRRRP
jgi:uncharacterized membrane protein